MCGIAAIISFNGRIAPAEISAFNSALQHRGPDDTGIFVANCDDYSIALGHVRLAVIDTSQRGHQPMGLAGNDRTAAIFTTDKELDQADLIIAYNGEIYNFSTLRDSLSQLGWTFQSGTDTEVLLKGYAEWGAELPGRLIGMYAFVIYDRANRQLVSYRDYPGVKPLYVYKGDDRIYLASELKAFADFDLPTDDARVREFYASKYIEFESMHAEVRCLPAGGRLQIDLSTRKLTQDTHSSLRTIFSPTAYRTRAAKTERQLVDDLDGLLGEVVDDQMVADVPVGTICSGGIDSSLVTAIARKSHPGLKIFSLDVKGTSEIEQARQVAHHLDLELIEIPFEKNDFDQLVDISAYFKDTPLIHPNSIAILKLSRIIKAHQVKVILSGEGADEVFGGYQKYIDYNRVLWLRRILPKLNKSLIPLIGDDNTVRMLVDDEISPDDLWRIWPTGDTRGDLQEWLRAHYLESGESSRGAEMGSFIAKDVQYYLNPLLRRADRMTMAVGIEGRVPMLDQRIIEFGINLPTKYKVQFMRGGKYLLKKVAERYLPKNIVWRTKKGLPIPVADWTGIRSKVQQKSFFLDLWQQNRARQGGRIGENCDR